MLHETERMSFRRWEEADAEKLYELAKDPAVGPIAGWPPHTSVEESRHIIRTVLSEPETFALVLKETGEPVGSIAFHKHSDLVPEGVSNQCELGYWLGQPFWGRGLMTEAVREMLRYGFEDLGMTTIWCGYYDGNERSHRVQVKSGFIYQWTTEDAPVSQMNETRRGHVNRLTKEEWLQAQA